MTEDLRAIARRWIDEDPDPETRAAAEALLAAGDEAALFECFGRRLEFGTAGLRGELGPGPNRMNRAVVRRVSAGLADYLLAQVEGAAERGVVIGFDGRHGSRVFARDAAAVLAGRGLRVHLHADVVPTPQLAHAVTFLGAAAGVMVTASHNPPRDNGYKVYWENGAQIIPPHDAGIAAAIDRISSLRGVAVEPLESLRARGRVGVVPEAAVEAYRAAVERLRVHRVAGSVRIIYTPLHGVARRLLESVLDRAGHRDRHVVAEQADPDPDFPTVRFPNPEEPGAMDRALALAHERGADLVIANDPDGDRLAVGVPDGRGGWRMLTGNEVGVLLADDLLAHGTGDGEPVVATTIVSSTLLSRIAADRGAAYFETLTGFKWIANGAIAQAARGRRFVLGYEEALGYTVGDVVRDKDGISAALLFCDLAAWCRARGETVLDHLADLHRRYGVHFTRQRSVTMKGAAGAAQILRIMAGLRGDPPAAVAGLAVERIRDFFTGEARDVGGRVLGTIDLPRSNVLAFDLAGGSRVLARPSGTEPKIKFYFEVREPVADGEPLEAAEERAKSALDRIESDFCDRALATAS